MKTIIVALLCYFIAIGPALSTTYYVSKSTDNSDLGYGVGNNANSGLSPNQAKLTIGSAITAAANGDEIVINNGTYTNAELNAGNNILDLNAKALKINPVIPYMVTLQTDSANNTIILIRNGNTTIVEIGKLILDCEKPSTPGTYINFGIQVNNAAVQLQQIYRGTKIQNCANTNILDNALQGIAQGYELIFAGFMNQGYSTPTNAGNTGIKKVHIDGLELRDITTINAASSRAVFVQRDATTTNEVSVYVNRLTGTITAPSSSGANAVPVGIALVNITDATNIAGTVVPPTIEGMNLTLNGVSTSNECIGVSATAPTGQVARGDHPIVRNGRFTFNCPAGRVLELGSSLVANAVDDPRAYGLTIVIPYYASATPHGISIGMVNGGEVYQNALYGGYTPILLSINQGAHVHDNYLTGCYGRCLYSKGSGGTIAPIWERNFVQLTNAYGPARGGALSIAIQGATNNASATYQDNTVCAVSDLYRYVDVDVAQVGSFARNNYYSYGPSGNATPWVYQANTYATFAAWKAAQEGNATTSKSICDTPWLPWQPVNIHSILNGAVNR